ncbi:MAG: HEAT repeat domain-containing protein [Acidobacteriota bacterium]
MIGVDDPDRPLASPKRRLAQSCIVKCNVCRADVVRVGAFAVCPEHGVQTITAETLSAGGTSHQEGAKRLFLSYGRRDASDLADRLNADLENRGYAVWHDTREITPGTSWQHMIADGLREAQVVVAVLTPHAVRHSNDPQSPDNVDSVCLAEIAFALFRPPPRPVVPVMAIPCEAPLAIFHLEYVDLCRWRESEIEYERGLGRLIDALEAAHRGEKRYRSWWHELDPWDFAAFLHDKRKGFQGRRWLFDQIDTWRSTSFERALLITGDPGVGKSAIVADLVHRNPGGQVLAYHCCQADTSKTLEAWRFVRSIAAMFASKLPAYASRLEDPGIRDVLGESSCRTDPASAFERGVLSPLQAIPAPEDTGRYILIDALDEALAVRSGELTIVRLLASRIERFPDWLRLIATTRKEPPVLERLGGLKAQEIDAQDPLNMQDLCNFVEVRLADDRLAAVVASHGSVNTVRDVLLGKAAGNFLYAKQVLATIERDPTFITQLESLPPRLADLYVEFFERQFPDGAGFERARTVLEVIVAAREPLTRELLAAATGLDANDLLPLAVDAVAAYVPRRMGADGIYRYSVFHKSLADWLTSVDRRGKTYSVVPAKGHARLAAAGQAEPTTAERSSYFLRHLPRHLALADRIVDLRVLLLSYEWMRDKLKVCSVFELIADYDLLGESDPLRLIQRALHLSAHALTTETSELPAQLVGRLASRSEPEIRRLVAEVRSAPPHGWSLLPRAATLRGPDSGVAFAWRACDRDPAFAIAVSDDGRVVAFVDKERMTFRTIETGLDVEPEDAFSRFPDADWNAWKRAAPSRPISHVLQGLHERSFEKRWSLAALAGSTAFEVRVHWKRNDIASRYTAGARYEDYIAQELFLATGGRRYRFESEAAPSACIAAAVSSDGRFLALAGTDGATCLWDLSVAAGPDGKGGWQAGSPVFTTNHSQAPVCALGIDPSGNRLATLDSNGMLSVDCPKEARLHAVGRPLATTAQEVFVAPAGDRVLVRDQLQNRTIWDAETASCLLHVRQDSSLGNLISVQVTHDVRYVLTIQALHDMYDGFLVDGIDLVAGKTTFSFETSGSKSDDYGRLPRGCSAAAGSYYVHPTPRDECINLHTGEARPLAFLETVDVRHVPWSEALTPEATSSAAITSDGWHARLQNQAADGSVATFTADEVLSRIDVSEDGLCAAVACVSGQMHFLDVIWQPADDRELEEKLAHHSLRIRCAATAAIGRRRGSDAGTRLRQLLRDPEALVRRRAAVELGRRRDHAAVEDLIVLLQDSDAGVREASIDALATLGQSVALAHALADEDVAVRRRAVEALGLLRDESAVGPLAPLLQDGDSRVVEAVIGALEQIGGRAAANVLKPFLEDSRIPLRIAAIRAVERADGQSAETLLTSLEHPDAGVREAAVAAFEALNPEPRATETAVRIAVARRREEACVTLGGAAVPALCRVLESADSSSVATAARALGQLGDARAVPALAAALRWQKEDAATEIAKALGALGSSAATPTLIDAFELGTSSQRTHILSALAKIGDAKAEGFIVRCLQHADRDVREAAAAAAAQLRQPEAVLPRLRSSFADGSPAAARALGVLRDRSMMKPLIAGLSIDDEQLRLGIVEALGNIGDAAAVSALTDCLTAGQGNSSLREFRKAAARALGRIGDTSTVPVLLAALDREPYDLGVNGLRGALAQALTDLAPAQTLVARLAQATIVDRTGYTRHSQKTLDIDVLRAIPSALSKIDASAGIDDIDQTVAHLVEGMLLYTDYAREEAADILAKLGEDAIPPIVAHLADGHWKVRMSLLRALGEIGSPKAFSVLKSALDDNDGHVRLAAVKALRTIGTAQAIATLG